jgi:hypothetical protein
MGVRVEVSLTVADNAPDMVQRILAGETLAAHRLGALSAEEAPLDIGTLIESQAVIPATDPEEGAAVTYDTPYAAKLHEHPEFNFQNGRKGKYLEDPALQHRDELGEIIAKQVRGE